MLNEIKILRELPHPCFITLHEMYESEQYVHLVYDVLKGEDLFGKIKKRQLYFELDVMRIMKSLLSGISHLHNKNVVHRDIKPDNIMISYFCDFIIS